MSSAPADVAQQNGEERTAPRRRELRVAVEPQKGLREAGDVEAALAPGGYQGGGPASDGAVAVALYNRDGGEGPATCDLNKTTGGYLEACGGGGPHQNPTVCII